MYTSTDAKPWTVPMLADAKRDGRKLVMLTAYDAGFARVMDDVGVDLVLVQTDDEATDDDERHRDERGRELEAQVRRRRLAPGVR